MKVYYLIDHLIWAESHLHCVKKEKKKILTVVWNT